MSLGRISALPGPPAGSPDTPVEVVQRWVLPLAEVRVPFTVSRPEIDDLARAARVAAEIDADVVHLYFEESFAFRVVEPDAAVVLT